MATLLDQIRADNAAFLDTEAGFAAQRDIDGVQVVAVVEPLPVGRAEQRYDGLLIRRRRLHVAAAALPAVPVPGQVMAIDGETWTVEDVTDDAGMLEVLLVGVDS